MDTFIKELYISNKNLNEQLYILSNKTSTDNKTILDKLERTTISIEKLQSQNQAILNHLSKLLDTSTSKSQQIQDVIENIKTSL
jgi:hypothetical protein